MKDARQRFDNAVADARAQRDRLRERLSLTRERFAPMRIAGDAKEAVEDRAKSTLDEVKAHPLRTGLTAGALLAWTFRDPLLRHAPDAIRRAYHRLAGYDSAGEPDDDTLPPEELQRG